MSRESKRKGRSRAARCRRAAAAAAHSDPDWASIGDVLGNVFGRLQNFSGQLGQCRLVCSQWRDAVDASCSVFRPVLRCPALETAPVLDAVAAAPPSSVLNAHAGRLRALEEPRDAQRAGVGGGRRVTRRTAGLPPMWPPRCQDQSAVSDLLEFYGSLVTARMDGGDIIVRVQQRVAAALLAELDACSVTRLTPPSAAAVSALRERLSDALAPRRLPSRRRPATAAPPGSAAAVAAPLRPARLTASRVSSAAPVNGGVGGTRSSRASKRASSGTGRGTQRSTRPTHSAPPPAARGAGSESRRSDPQAGVGRAPRESRGMSQPRSVSPVDQPPPPPPPAWEVQCSAVRDRWLEKMLQSPETCYQARAVPRAAGARAPSPPPPRGRPGPVEPIAGGGFWDPHAPAPAWLRLTAPKPGFALTASAPFWTALTAGLALAEPAGGSGVAAPPRGAAGVGGGAEFVVVRALFFVVGRVLAVREGYARACASHKMARQLDVSRHEVLDECLIPALPALGHVTRLCAGIVGFADVHTHDAGALDAFHALEPLSEEWLRRWLALCTALPRLRDATFSLEWSLSENPGAIASTAAAWASGLRNLTSLRLTVLPPELRTQAQLPLAPLTRLSRLCLTFGRLDTELESLFTAQRVADIVSLPALAHLSLTLVNHAFEQAAADALSDGTRLTALEIMRHVPHVPMQFFEFHDGVEWLKPLTRLQRLKLSDARFVCGSPEARWEPLGRLTGLRALFLSGAHLGWKDYSHVSRLTALTELQLVHCKGPLRMRWLLCMPALERLYLKGNGPTPTQMLLLCGGTGALAAMTQLRDLYLGLATFAEEDGEKLAAMPCISEASHLSTLRALTLTDSPYAMDRRAAGGAFPVTAALAAMTGLTRLRVGFGGVIGDVRRLDQRGSSKDAYDAVKALMCGVAALSTLRDLTLDCHGFFAPSHLQKIAASNTALRTLRLMGDSSCRFDDLTCLRPLRLLTRLVIGPSFFCDGASVLMNGGEVPVPPGFGRALEGLSPRPGGGGSLRVLQVHGVLQAAVRDVLRGSKRLACLQFGEGGATVWQDFREPPPPSSSQTGKAVFMAPAAGRSHWEEWPYEASSDDDEYGVNTPVWRGHGRWADDDDASASDVSGWDSDDSLMLGLLDDEDEHLYEIGDFYDPFNRRMLIGLDSDDDLDD